MSNQTTIGPLLATVLNIYLIVLIARLIMDYVLMFNRGYRPSGGVAVLFDVVFKVTDPPLKALRRVIPPLRIGSVAIDLGFLILFIGIRIVASAVATL